MTQDWCSWLTCVVAKVTAALMGLLLVIIQETWQKPTVMSDLPNPPCGLAVELIRADTWPIQMAPGCQQPAQLNWETTAEYWFWWQLKLYTSASGRKEERGNNKTVCVNGSALI